MLFKDENKENKDETQKKFSRNPIVKLISVRCPTCRKATRELINKDEQGIIKCSQKGCDGQIDLSKAKIREVTGFNNAFINKINKLRGTDE